MASDHTKHGSDHERDHHNHSNPNHSHTDGHGHTHGLVDPSILRSKQGVKAVSISLAVLMVTSIAQFILFGISNSVALLADVIHNGGDALTALPLGLAFFLRSKRGEKWAGYCVVFVILVSAMLALYQVVTKFINPTTPSHIWAIILAGAIGVIGNETAAVIRWRAGKKLNSPALIADGNHARADGLVSIGVIVGAVFIAVGVPVADPIIGLAITLLILKSSWDSWLTIRGS